MITKRSISKPDSKKEAWRNRDKASRTTILHCSRPLSSSQTTTRPDRTRPTGPQAHGVPPGASGKPHATKSRVAVREPKSIPIPLPARPQGPAKPTISSTPARPHQTGDDPRRMGHTTDARPASSKKLRRKEVIQPHLPVRLPCYDLVPITSLTLDGSIPQGVRPPASGAAHFHDLTGGVYKARERIHRDVADSRLLATPPSRSRVADCDPN